MRGPSNAADLRPLCSNGTTASRLSTKFTQKPRRRSAICTVTPVNSQGARNERASECPILFVRGSGQKGGIGSRYDGSLPMDLAELQREMAAAVMLPLTRDDEMRAQAADGRAMTAVAESFIAP